MTANELRILFNDSFGLTHWPDIYEVDHVTFANVCAYIFRQHAAAPQQISVALGPYAGIMFKGVEIVLNPNGFKPEIIEKKR